MSATVAISHLSTSTPSAAPGHGGQKHPIPACYSCYLLRSLGRGRSVYVGSTPAILRRWKQHNGLLKGGAAQTSRSKWEVTCIVHGFPSKIAALQFERAWFKPHLTRHIAPESRLTHATAKSKVSPRTGRTKTSVVHPRTSLPDKISYLHLLLRSKSFSRWPLTLRFFSSDAYVAWQRWDGRTSDKVRSGIRIVLDPLASLQSENPTTETASLSVLPIPPALAAFDTTYNNMKPHLAKARLLLAKDSRLECKICKGFLSKETDSILICPHPSCEATVHLACLSKRFLNEESSVDQLIPISGSCPNCKQHTKWIDLVKELSLRTVDQDLVNKLLDEPKRRVGERKGEGWLGSPSKFSSVTEFDHDDDWFADQYEAESDMEADHEVVCISDVDEEDSQVPPSGQGEPFRWSASPSRLRVVDDSDWDDVEVFD